MTTLVQETAADRATRISQLNKTRDELKKITGELIGLREEQRSLVAERRAAEARHKAESLEAQKVRVTQLRQQRDLEQKLNMLNKALRRAMTLQQGIDSIAAFVPWNVEIEGEALWWALTAPSAKSSK
jgi:septal ring factor EnvC (AmiA/AmiB activator)